MNKTRFKRDIFKQVKKFIVCLHMIDDLEGIDLDNAIRELKKLLAKRKRGT